MKYLELFASSSAHMVLFADGHFPGCIASWIFSAHHSSPRIWELTGRSPAL
jgi:hypothetical protein